MLRRKEKRIHIEDNLADVVASGKRRRGNVSLADEEEQLAEFVFNDGSGVLEGLSGAAKHGIATGQHGAAGLSDDDNLEEEDEEVDDGASARGRSLATLQPAWEDEDDAEVRVDIKSVKRTRKLRVTPEETVLDGEEYSERLRKQFRKVAGDPSWANVSVRTVGQGSEGDGDIDMLQRTQPMLAGSVSNLPKGILDISRIKDANWADAPNAGIQSIQFHPQAPVVLTAGLHKKLRLYEIDNKTNPMLHSMYMKKFPIHTALFSPDGQQIVMSSRRSFFYVFDIPSNKAIHVPGIRGRQEKSLEYFAISPDNKFLAFTGRDGSILLVSNKSKQLVDCLRMSGSVIALAFTPSGEHLLSAGSDGRVCVWDMSTRSCCHSFVDDASYHITSLAVAPESKHVAVGNSMGVVNVYDDSCFKVADPKPLRTLHNLAPAASSCLQFNPSGEMLALSTRRMERGLRLAHFPSTTVFSNWPKQTGKLSYVQCLSFSSNSEYMAVGNDKGKALLFRLNHYKSETES